MSALGGAGGPKLTRHWQWRPEWAQDRACLYWYLVVDDDRLAEAWDRLVATLRRAPWLDVVPPRWWHVTLCDVGFADELDRVTVAAVAEAVTDVVTRGPHGTGPLRLGCGRTELFATAVTVRVGPRPALQELQGTVRDTTQQVLGDHRPLVHCHEFRPHLSLGYANRCVTGDEVDPVLAALPHVPAEVTVDRLSLVAVTRRDGHYQWAVEHEVPLGVPLDVPVEEPSTARPRTRGVG